MNVQTHTQDQLLDFPLVTGPVVNNYKITLGNILETPDMFTKLLQQLNEAQAIKLELPSDVTII